MTLEQGCLNNRSYRTDASGRGKVLMGWAGIGAGGGDGDLGVDIESYRREADSLLQA